MNGDRPVTIADLIDRYLAWAVEYYGVGRTEAANMRDALKPLAELSGAKPIDALAAEDLAAVQEHLVGRGVCRATINARINRIRRAMRWARKPGRRWISAAQLEDLTLVEGFRRGRCSAKESPGVRSVGWELVSATMAAAPWKLASLIELHWHTGMRSSELVRLQATDIQRDGDLVIYRPRRHKTEHYGQERVIVIGPEGASALQALLRAASAAGKTRICGYSANSYRQAIVRVNRRAGLRGWTPLQLRHSFATRMRSLSGLDVAQCALGHSQVKTTERYAERDLNKLKDAARRHC
jgi:integrase